MRSRLLAGVVLAICVVGAGTARAVEPYLEFVQGLQERQYFDYAILYLDQIATNPNTPAEVKQVIPYEKAKTLQASASVARSPEKQVEQLDQALAFLEEFVKANPTHPIAADANSDRAMITLKKAQAEIMQSKSPSAQKRQLQTSARELLAKAREVFQTAFDQHEANFKKYPVFIDQAKEPEQYATRAKIESNMMSALLSLAICTFEEAHTYDSTATEYKQLLTKAADEFEKIHQKYRTQVGGLTARAWQGKCFEEMNDINKALGIYKEILDHPAETGPLSQLKTQTLYFKLICLNGSEKKDYRVVADLAEEWMKRHANEQLSRFGISIQYQQALAYEALGDNKELLKADQETFWKKSRSISMNIQRFNSEHKDAAVALTQRLQVKLGNKDDKINDFDTAFGLASQAVQEAGETKKEIDEAMKNKATPPDHLAKLNAARANYLDDAEKYFGLALTLVKTDDDRKTLPRAYFGYAHVKYGRQQYFESAVLGQYVARTADKDDPLALEGAYLAMASFVQAYNENKAPTDQKGEDLQLIIRASNLIAERWPSSDKANDAYMMLGKMFSLDKKPAEAAMWYGKVPESDPKYADAQLAAGQAYWSAYINAARMIATERPNPAQLTEWQTSAQNHLRVGIKKLTDTAPKEASPPELIGAKMTLAQIIINQGQEAEALKLLEGEPHSVVKAVTVADETKRPAFGMTSRRFAKETYMLVFRAYVGTQNIEKARATMKTLETIAGAGAGDDEGGGEITELYISLGRLLKEELDRLKANGENERFEKLMGSFETILNDMAARTEGQTYGTLSWIGETYFALGESIAAADAAKANAFYEKAGKAFTDILTRATADQNFVPAKRLHEVKLRLVRIYRIRKDFPPAEALMTEILKEYAKDLRVQISVAEMYQDWGVSGQTDSPKKLVLAIDGNTRKDGPIWGWGQISAKFQASPKFPADEFYKQTFLDARYHTSFCRREYAQSLPAKEKQRQLEGCLVELVTTSAIIKDMAEEEYQRFNALYRLVLADLGRPVTDLPRAVDVPVAPPAEKVKDPATVKKVDEPKWVKPEPVSMTTWLIFGGCLVAGVGIVVVMIVRAKAKPTQKSFGGPTAKGPVSFSGVVGMEPLPPPTFVAPTAKPKPRPAVGGTAGAGAKPATKPAAKPGTPGATAAKPKPKPPSPPPK